MTRLPMAEDALARDLGPAAPAKVGIISLGCPKNLVDTEVLLGRVAADHMVCGDPLDADVVIVNTCGFIDQAREESLEVIAEVARWKAEGKIQGMVVAGCLAQRWGERIRDEAPNVDAVVGMAEYGQISDVLGKVLTSRGPAPYDGPGAAPAPWRTLVAEDPSYPVPTQTGRLRVTPRHYAYLQVSEGCDNACTFCSIPLFRGLFRSKPREAVLAEARELIAAGARELNIISQDTTDWGKDLPGSGGLGSLLRDVSALGPDWIRLLYAYPGHVDDALITALRELENVVPYLDIPVQHIASPLLKRMGRRHTRSQTHELLQRLREEVPGLVLRTTFIVGFPGETEEHFAELCEFVEQFRFERLGAFPYSHEPDTPAGERFEDDVPAQVKAERVERLMLLQQPIAFAHAQAQVGRTLDVLLDHQVAAPIGEGEAAEAAWIGRSAYDAPEIDPFVRIEGKLEASSGDLVRVQIVGTDEYDLVGRAG
jgi:ribosomal protein S12 methylthiotransferase